GGIRAWLVEEHSIPFTAIELRFEGGTSLECPGKGAATVLTMPLREDGPGDLAWQGSAEARERLPARVESDAFDDAAAVSAQMLTENLREAVALLKPALPDPHFDEASMTRVKGQVASIIRSDETDPNAIATRAFDRLAFGDHR